MTASGPLLETKLFAPQSSGGLVPRPELLARIRQGLGHKLTLLSAPAGFGKTTLLAEWLGEGGRAERAVGWVSLDANDNEPALFWAYVVTAFRRACGSTGGAALSALETSGPLTSVVAALVNEAQGADQDVLLILDDYHVIESRAIHDSLAFLLDHLPARMRILIASRTDPPLPLPRLRARGELTELRTSDLRFTAPQAAAFLNEVMALDLAASDVARLERRTEGWIAALKMAALSLRGRSDARRLVEAFSGDSRYVADYLAEEVLAAQPERIRRFLLATAMLDQMSAPLCDAVLDQSGSQTLLEELERANLFVVALDDRREWYRYHHLFADALQTHAVRADPDGVRAAHGRASGWHERRGSRVEAVRHAMSAGDLGRAANLLETQWPAKNRSYESARWLERVRTLPDEMVRARPVLGMGLAWALLNAGELEAAAARIEDVERRLNEGVGAADGVVTDGQRLDTLPFELESARVYLAQALDDAPGTVEHARRALALIPADDLHARATGTALLALASWARGDLEDAYTTFADALALMTAAGATLDVARGTFVLGDIRVAQGRLREAKAVYERGLELAKRMDPAASPETDELYLGLCELNVEWGDLGAAAGFLDRIVGKEGVDHRGNRERWCTATAAIRVAVGDLDGGLTLLDEAEGARIRGPLPRVRPLGASRARIWAKQGRTSDALSWLRARGLSASDELLYLREFEHVTLARVLLVHRNEEPDGVGEALRLLERLAAAAESGGRMGSLIETLVLQALASRARGDVRRALVPLGRALLLAEPEGFLRVFLDEGDDMRDLLRHALARGIAPEFARRVLSAFEPVASAPPPEARAPGTAAAPALTPKEITVLRLIASGLRNREIAEHLFISPATVKRHIANAYAKLGVGHRTQALLRARELNLL